ncbi:MAG: DoxX family protein [Terracidiphilus sp.]
MHSSSEIERLGTARSRIIGYWIITGLLVAEMLMGGIWDVARTRHVVEVVTQLGYPAYILTILGVWKLLAVPALLAPRLPLLKEWAYAGIFFEMTGAAVSHMTHGGGSEVIVTLVTAALAVSSWWLRPKSRRAGGIVAATVGAQEAR